jgi:hypothetical protein
MFLGRRYAWKLNNQIDVGEEGILTSSNDANAFFIPDLTSSLDAHSSARQGPLVSMSSAMLSSESFKHEFLENNKPWILRQLGINEYSTGAQLPEINVGSSISEETPWDQGKKLQLVLARGDITDDSSDEDATALRNRVRKIMTKQIGKMNPVCRLILFRWLARTRRRLGIPDLLVVADNITDEDSSADEQVKHGVLPEISTKAQAIARFWRSLLAKGGEEVNKFTVQVSDDSGGDEQSNEVLDRLVTNHVRDIARLWLQQMREDQLGGGVRRVKNIVSDESDDDQESDGFDIDAAHTFQRPAVRTAPVSSDTGDDTGSSLTAAGGTTSSHGPDERVPAHVQTLEENPKTSARSARSARSASRASDQSEPEDEPVEDEPQDVQDSTGPAAQQDAPPAPILPKTRRIARMWLDMMNDALSNRSRA